MSNILLTPIEYLKNVGPARGEIFRKELDVHRYIDLVQLFPTRYLDKTQYYKINQVRAGNTEIQIVGKIIHLKTVEQKNKKRLVATFVDDTGKMELNWFQGHKYISDTIKLNTPMVIFGKVSIFNGTISMSHPEMETLEDHKLHLKSSMQAVYPSTEKLSKKGITHKVIHKLVYQIFQETQARFAENLPANVIDELRLISKAQALYYIHFPKDQDTLQRAQFRLKFEELFYTQLQLISKNLVRKYKVKGHKFEQIGSYFTTFYEQHLPFELTNAQKRVVKEIRKDMAREIQMNRLLQGDVGAGKTMVAFLSMLIALDNQYQCCLMAPTEILANQHYLGLKEMADKIGVRIALLTGSSKTAERKEILETLENGELQILIGTHALLEEKVQFNNLGLAIIDEQHRFGVEQRAKLWLKNDIPPHVLVMTATPIPRTLAMSMYGDLDISIIDELPPGRKPITTIHKYESGRLQVLHFMRQEIAKGRQIYMVYPLIQESEKMDYHNLMDGFEATSREFPYPNYSIAIVHGKMKPHEKEEEMKRFVEGKANIMIATTVIEVGVNVPNASVMIIESSERFGLSQLHQLRGRVGRGAEQSYCILMTGQKLSEDSKKRIETMCRTNDGFDIAEVDLKLRGPGDIMGTQQSGIMNFKIADLVKDRDIMELARHHAIKLLQKDPALELEMHNVVKKTFQELERNKTIWNFIS